MITAAITTTIQVAFPAGHYCPARLGGSQSPGKNRDETGSADTEKI